MILPYSLRILGPRFYKKSDFVNFCATNLWYKN